MCSTSCIVIEGEQRFQDFDPEKGVWLDELRPDVLTKGADYEGREVVGSSLVDEVRLISFVEGRSTSRTIEQIKRAA